MKKEKAEIFKYDSYRKNFLYERSVEEMKQKMEDFDANVFVSVVTFLASKKNICAFMLHDGQCILFFW